MPNSSTSSASIVASSNYELPNQFSPDLESKIQLELSRRSGSRRLADFARQAWHIIEPVPLRWSWHCDAICDHLEAVTRGEIKRLIINVPPRHGKSNLF